MTDAQSWIGSAQEYLDILNVFIDGQISALDYRDRIRRLNAVEEYIEDACPIRPVVSELVHDANEFVLVPEYRESEDLSEQELRIRASFARDVIRISMWYYALPSNAGEPPMPESES